MRNPVSVQVTNVPARSGQRLQTAWGQFPVIPFHGTWEIRAERYRNVGSEGTAENPPDYTRLGILILMIISA
jgi:hypothetical protein